MDKNAIDIEDLIKELRYCAATATCSGCPWNGLDCTNNMKKKAADALEQYHRSAKFHKFVWETLGSTNMRQLIEMYHEDDEEDS